MKWEINNREEVIIDQDQEFSYLKFLNRLLELWWVFLLSLLIACAIAFLANRYMTPIYLVNASVLVKAEKEISNPISDLFYGDEYFGRNSTNIENECSLIGSYRLIDKTIRDLNLDVSYYREGRVRNEEIYLKSPIKLTVLSEDGVPNGRLLKCRIEDDNTYSLESVEETNFLQKTLEWLGISQKSGFTLREKGLTFGQPVSVGRFNFAVDFVADSSDRFVREVLLVIDSYQNLTKIYRRDLSVAPKSPESSIINLSMEGPVPEKVMDFMNKLIANYIEGELDQKNLTAQRTIEFIEHQIGFTGDSLRSVEARLENFKRSNAPIDLSQEGSQLFNSLESLEEQRLLLNMTVKYLDDQRGYLSNNNFDQLIAPSSLGIEDANLNSQMVQLINSHAEMKAQEASGGTLNPLIQLKKQGISTLRELVLENIKNLLSTYRLRIESMDAQIAAVRSSMRSLPVAERQLIDMQRTQSLNEELFIFLMQKKFEAGIAKSSNTPDYRIVDDATVKGIVPVRPSPILNYALAIFLGLLIPAGLILVYDFFNNKVTSKSELKKLTSIPIFGQIPSSTLKSTETLVTSISPRSGIAEAFRSVRSNLRYLRTGGEVQCETFLITSSISGEGKSFCSNNLAYIFSNFGKKVVLINADMRKKYSYKEFGIEAKLGLSDYLAGIADVPEVVYASIHKNLSIIAAGSIPPNPSELLINGNFEALILRLRREFDYIILDTPPVGLLSDGMELMKLADVNLFVVRQGYTLKKDIEELNLISKSINNKLAILFNDVKLRRKKYGYGYYEEDRVKGKLSSIFAKKEKVA